jgi:hypothetical protein
LALAVLAVLAVLVVLVVLAAPPIPAGLGPATVVTALLLAMAARVPPVLRLLLFTIP